MIAVSKRTRDTTVTASHPRLDQDPSRVGGEGDKCACTSERNCKSSTLHISTAPSTQHPLSQPPNTLTSNFSTPTYPATAPQTNNSYIPTIYSAKCASNTPLSSPAATNAPSSSHTAASPTQIRARTWTSAWYTWIKDAESVIERSRRRGWRLRTVEEGAG